MDDYVIPFHGLKEGIHEYDFEAGSTFLASFENADITGGRLKVHLKLDKTAQFLHLTFTIRGTLETICDRCLDRLDFPVNVTEQLIVRFGEEAGEISDTVIIIPRDESTLNIAQYIYEFSALALPVRKMHPVDPEGKTGCDPEMIRKLNEHTSNHSGESDPRWDALRNLMNKNN